MYSNRILTAALYRWYWRREKIWIKTYLNLNWKLKLKTYLNLNWNKD